MRRALLVLVVLMAAAEAVAQLVPAEEKKPAPPKAPEMAPAGTWGASWEPTARPGGPALAGVPWLQALVDAAPEGSTLVPPPGVYSGPVVLQKRLTIDGKGKVTIDGGGRGTVFVLEASGATLRGLTFTGSGDSHNTDDACLNVRGSHDVIEDNRFEDCLFGVDLKQSNENRVAKNHIRSLRKPLGQRGDGVRLWYSMKNRIEENVLEDSRDFVVWYSNDNHIARNVGRRGRYALHFMYAQRNVVEENRYDDNSVGIYVMYTDGVEIRNNVISHSLGPTGMGIGFTEASDSVLEGNSIVYCAIGIDSDLSPYQPDSTITITRNRVAYNGVGISFTGDKTGMIIEGNVFEGNLDQVAHTGGRSTKDLGWKGNFWDDYQGFDRDGDGVGDTPYELFAYTDRIWMETPHARFFKNAPLMEAIDFLERLAPFSSPELMVRDEQPLFRRPDLLPSKERTHAQSGAKAEEEIE